MADGDVIVVRCELRRKNLTTGQTHSLTSGNTTISENLRLDTVWVVIPRNDVPETADYPLVEDYIEAMGARSTPHVPVIVNQTMVITKNSSL